MEIQTGYAIEYNNGTVQFTETSTARTLCDGDGIQVWLTDGGWPGAWYSIARVNFFHNKVNAYTGADEKDTTRPAGHWIPSEQFPEGTPTDLTVYTVLNDDDKDHKTRPRIVEITDLEGVVAGTTDKYWFGVDVTWDLPGSDEDGFGTLDPELINSGGG